MPNFNDMVYHLGGIPAGGAYLTTGNAFYVDSGKTTTGADSPECGKSADRPFLTLDYAIGQATASNGDVIYVMPGHAETITSAVTCDCIGLSIIGLGRGRNIPAFTGSGAIDVFTITGASTYIGNIRIVGASASVTSLVNLAAADIELGHLVVEPAETPLMTFTIAAGAHRFHIHDLKWRGSAGGPDVVFDFEAKVYDWIIEDCFINARASGCDLGVFRANAVAAPGGFIKNVHAIGVDTLFVDFNSSIAVGEGMFIDCSWQHTAAATAANGYDLGGYGMHRTGVSDGANRAAIIHPATSAT